MRKKDSKRASKRGQAVIKIQDILNRCFVGHLYDYDNAAARRPKEELPLLTKKNHNQLLFGVGEEPMAQAA